MKKGYLFILLSTLLFSTMEITLKVVSADYNPIQLTFLRFLIGSIVLFPLAWKGLKKRQVKLGIPDFTFFALTGLICVVVSMVFFQMAILYAQASVVAILFSCNPVFVIPLAVLLLKEKLYKQTVISLFVSLIGMIVIMNPFHMQGSATGIILALLSAATFALYGVTSGKRSERYGVFATTCFSFIFGASEMLVLILISRTQSVSSFLSDHGFAVFASIPIFQGLSFSSIPGLFYIGVCITGFGYVFYFLAMDTTSAATASLVFFFKPALAPVLAFFILSEPLTHNKMVGILFILGGSLISLTRKWKAASLVTAQNQKKHD